VIERLQTMLRVRKIPLIKRILDEREAKGEAKGRAEGEAKGRAEGRAEALSDVLRKRLGQLGQVSAALSRKIANVTDVAGLERLVAIALEVETLDAFRKPSLYYVACPTSRI